MIIIGPEKYLVQGWSDIFNKSGIPCFGPSATAARLEGSKTFFKDFMFRNGIPTARYATFTNYDAALQYLSMVDYPIVIKVSDLAAGKGVVLPSSKEEVIEYLKQVMVDKIFGEAGEEVVIEERLVGEELSVLAFCDGENFHMMPSAQDHKRIFDNDQGPNTGGMGAYAPAPALSERLIKEVKEKVLQPTLDAAAKEGFPFTGVIYPGLMLIADGVKVLEYNYRFGDPETQAILPLMKSDILDTFAACIEGRLNFTNVEWYKDQSSVTIVMASEGYPGKVTTGFPISGLPSKRYNQ